MRKDEDLRIDVLFARKGRRTDSKRKERRAKEEVGEIAAQSMITGEKGEGEREDDVEGADRGCSGQLLPISLLLCFIRCCDAMTHPMGGRSANTLHSAVSMEFMQPFENDSKFCAVCWVPNHPPSTSLIL